MKRGEIYVVDLGPGVGREASGVCPVVIVSNDVSNSVPLFVSVVPAVDASAIIARLGILVPASGSGYPADIAVLATQPRTIDPSRFTAGPVGAVPVALMDRISYSLRGYLDLHTVPLPGP